MKKILILTASFGDGHNAAARNLRDALELVSDEVKVEVLDLFDSTYGTFNSVLKNTYLGLVRYAPGLWGGIYSLLDSSSVTSRQVSGLARLKDALVGILDQTQPDCVVSTYPAYPQIIQEIYRDHSERPFRLITVVTDSITVNSTWYRSPSDFFCVPNEATPEVLRQAGVSELSIKPLGFPVSPVFAEASATPIRAPDPAHPARILYVINTGKKKVGRAIDRLLDIPDLQFTICVGRDAELKLKLAERGRQLGQRVRVLGWTNQMPRLLLNHHLIVGKAGGATVQESFAARCPMIVNQIIPGQEKGNAQLIEHGKLGAVATQAREVADWIARAFAYQSRLWHEWRDNLAKISRPDASLRIAELILSECQWANRGPTPRSLFTGASKRAGGTGPAISNRAKANMLLCDFHIHTNYSDGKLTLARTSSKNTSKCASGSGDAPGANTICS